MTLKILNEKTKRKEKKKEKRMVGVKEAICSATRQQVVEDKHRYCEA